MGIKCRIVFLKKYIDSIKTSNMQCVFDDNEFSELRADDRRIY